jgi:hypothetical protein
MKFYKPSLQPRHHAQPQGASDKKFPAQLEAIAWAEGIYSSDVEICFGDG